MNFHPSYWDFLLRHEKRLAGHLRMAMPLRNFGRLTEADRLAIREQAGQSGISA